MNTADEFWAKAEPVTESGCWIWMGASSPKGYGTVRWRGRYVGAHRVAAQLSGADVSGAVVCHKCDTPSCVNPDHLYLGTYAQNSADMISRNRNNPCRGEASGRAKLTEKDVRYVKQSASPSQELADRFGVSRNTIQQIRSGRRWAHIVA